MCLKIIILIIYVLWGILKNIITYFIFQCTEGDTRYGSKYIQLQINKYFFFILRSLEYLRLWQCSFYTISIDTKIDV